MHAAAVSAAWPCRYHPAAMAETQDKPLPEQLEEIRAQLDWVRDYL
jgi:hypothetical protein